ncbi:hypothetical protein [Streptomyces sp. NPDC047525]|uniref:hypothetical protein n=1 Tax=Streptomyces sp. NPDC047525 TaxID=3155264 RepID=UPI0033FFF8C6
MIAHDGRAQRLSYEGELGGGLMAMPGAQTAVLALVMWTTPRVHRVGHARS